MLFKNLQERSEFITKLQKNISSLRNKRVNLNSEFTLTHQEFCLQEEKLLLKEKRFEKQLYEIVYGDIKKQIAKEVE